MDQPETDSRRLQTGSLAHGAAWMFAGQGTNVALRAAYFILLARLLGVTQYGIFVGAFAFVSLATPFSSLGSGLVFMQHVASNCSDYALYWGNILLTTAGVGVLLAIAMSYLAPHFLNPASASVALMVAISECIFQQLFLCTGQVFQTFEHMRMMAVAGVFGSAFRLLAVVFLTVWVHRATARQWAEWSMIASALAAAAGIALVTKTYGRPRFSSRLSIARLGEGLNFSIASSTQSVYNDMDKTILSHYGMNVANGIYTMAYRIVDIASIPILALDAAVLPRFFREGSTESIGRLSRRLAKRGALLGIAAAVVMFICAPVIPILIGKGFEGSVSALRWLCLIPALRAVHQLSGSAITGAGCQRYRTAAQFSAAAFNFGLCLWLIPRFGWIGAAWTSLATDGSLGLVNWILVGKLPSLTARGRRDALRI